MQDWTNRDFPPLSPGRSRASRAPRPSPCWKAEGKASRGRSMLQAIGCMGRTQQGSRHQFKQRLRDMSPLMPQCLMWASVMEGILGRAADRPAGPQSCYGQDFGAGRCRGSRDAGVRLFGTARSLARTPALSRIKTGAWASDHHRLPVCSDLERGQSMAQLSSAASFAIFCQTSRSAGSRHRSGIRRPGRYQCFIAPANIEGIAANIRTRHRALFFMKDVQVHTDAVARGATMTLSAASSALASSAVSASTHHSSVRRTCIVAWKVFSLVVRAVSAICILDFSPTRILMRPSRRTK